MRLHAGLPPLGSSIIHALHQGGTVHGFVRKEQAIEELEQAEPDGAGGSWMGPDAQTLRTILGNLSLEQFYHSVIALAGEALALRASEEA